MLIESFDLRPMESDLAEHVVARLFIGRPTHLQAQSRDPSHIARADAALGQAGIEEVNPVMIQEADGLGFVDAGSLSSETTGPELPIGYPNESGILRGLAQRGGRALSRLKHKGVIGLEGALDPVQMILRSVKAPHLFTRDKTDKRHVWVRLLTEVGEWRVSIRPLVTRLESSSGTGIQSARSRLMAMPEVIKPLRGQRGHGISTGKVAATQIIHVGIPQARAIVRHQAGQKREFGLAYLLNRLGGGYLFGTRIAANADEKQMPLRALAEYRRS